MTSPRGSRAVGRRAGGDDVTAAPSADAGQAEAVTAAAGPASGAPDQTPANGSSAQAGPASGSPARTNSPGGTTSPAGATPPAGTTIRGPSAGPGSQLGHHSTA